MSIQRFNSTERMSPAVVHNGTVYLSGQVGTAGDSVTEQTKTILSKIENLLTLAGSNKSSLLMTTIWLSDMRYFTEMNAVWDAWIESEHAPARCCGEAILARPTLFVEIMVVAAVAD